MPSFTLSRRRALTVLGAALVAVVLGSRLLPAPASPGPASPAAVPVRVAGAAPPASHVVVDVEGAVRRPGLYRLRSGARIAEAIAHAGGVTRAGERAAVNFAAPVADGAQIFVPRRLPGSPTGSPPPMAAVGPLSLSSATAEQLDPLPGIGPVTAQKIVDYRQLHGPFRSVDELDAIAGIGPARLESLRGLVVP